MNGPLPWELSTDEPMLVITVDPAGLANVWTRWTPAEAITVLAQILRHATETGGLPPPTRTTVHRVRRPRRP